ncbi:hypothetical protein DRJ17_00370 [Candidatus Woesearchaeota archaeon]|nr:MAG: hypothetical protein DRJ17_00370 [Candidatus Woesearchaeota archaeon]
MNNDDQKDIDELIRELFQKQEESAEKKLLLRPFDRETLSKIPKRASFDVFKKPFFKGVNPRFNLRIRHIENLVELEYHLESNKNLYGDFFSVSPINFIPETSYEDKYVSSVILRCEEYRKYNQPEPIGPIESVCEKGVFFSNYKEIIIAESFKRSLCFVDAKDHIAVALVVGDGILVPSYVKELHTFTCDIEYEDHVLYMRFVGPKYKLKDSQLSVYNDSYLLYKPTSTYSRYFKQIFTLDALESRLPRAATIDERISRIKNQLVSCGLKQDVIFASLKIPFGTFGMGRSLKERYLGVLRDLYLKKLG